jgi:hypothetical protein
LPRSFTYAKPARNLEPGSLSNRNKRKIHVILAL